MKYRFVKYFTPTHVSIYGNCCEMGHSQRKCRQRDRTIYMMCSVSYVDIKAHVCSGLPKCIRCGEDHKPTYSKCAILKNYRTALTRNLLQQYVHPATVCINTNRRKRNYESHLRNKGHPSLPQRATSMPCRPIPII
jgi:hypothetical protein